MQRFLVRRFIVSILTLLAVSLIIFVMSRAVGDPTYLYLGNPEDVTQEDVDAMRSLLGLDKHPVHQYGIFLKNLATGNLGESIRERRPVSEVIMERAARNVDAGGFLVRIRSCARDPHGHHLGGMEGKRCRPDW